MRGNEYYSILLDGLPRDPDLRVAQIVRGVAWTAALLSDGRCGVGMRRRGSANSPLSRSAGAPLMPEPPMSIPRV